MIAVVVEAPAGMEFATMARRNRAVPMIAVVVEAPAGMEFATMARRNRAVPVIAVLEAPAGTDSAWLGSSVPAKLIAASPIRGSAEIEASAGIEFATTTRRDQAVPVIAAAEAPAGTESAWLGSSVPAKLIAASPIRGSAEIEASAGMGSAILMRGGGIAPWTADAATVK
jgi:hypothetical protein